MRKKWWQDRALRAGVPHRVVRAGAALLTVSALAVTASACDRGGTSAGSGGATRRATPSAAPTGAVTAAYRRTAAAGSARVQVKVRTSGTGPGSGTVDMAGVQGWRPQAMDVTVKGGALSAAPQVPGSARLLRKGDVLYLDVHSAGAAYLHGKHWLRLDLDAAGDSAGRQMVDAMTAGLRTVGQDPSEQLAMALASPGLTRVGQSTVGGTTAQHYRAHLTATQLARSASHGVAAAERTRILAAAKKAGVRGYDTDIWVGPDGLPLKSILVVTSTSGTSTMTAEYSHYGTALTVKPPAAGSTLDVARALAGASADHAIPGRG